MGGLSSLLVQDQILSVTQIEQTLQRQVILGGDLPTILLELGMLEESVLVEYMSKVVGISILPVDTYAAIDKSAGERILRDTAISCKAVPIQCDDHLVVAVTGTLAPQSVQKLAEESRKVVIPQLVLEFRFSILMNQVYGVPLPGRMSTLQKKLVPDFKESLYVVEDTRPLDSAKVVFQRQEAAPKSSGQHADEQNQVDQHIHIQSSADDRLNGTSKLYRGADSSDRILIESNDSSRDDITRQGMALRMDAMAAKVRLTVPPESSEPSEPSESSYSPEQSSEPSVVETAAGDAKKASHDSSSQQSVEQGSSTDKSEQRVSIDDIQNGTKGIKNKLISYSVAAELLERAKNRDDIIETFFRFAHQAFDFTLLTIVHGDDASGRLAAFRGGEFNDADFISIHLKNDGLFGTAFETAKHRIGAMDDSPGMEVLNQLGLDVPLNAAVVPIVLKKRVIMLLYGDSGHHGIRAKRVERITAFSHLVARAFERLLLNKKYSKFSSASPSTAPVDIEELQSTIKIEPQEIATPKRDMSAWAVAAQPISISPDSIEQPVSEAAESIENSEIPEIVEVLNGSGGDVGEKVTAQAPSIIAGSKSDDELKEAFVSDDYPTENDGDTEIQGEPQRVSVSPRAHLGRHRREDNTLRIHVDTSSLNEPSQTPVHTEKEKLEQLDEYTVPLIRPSVHMVMPIQVTREPKDVSLANKEESDKNATATVTQLGSKTGVTTSSPVKLTGQSKPASPPQEEEQLSSIPPKHASADGRYMHVEKSYSKVEKHRVQDTMRRYPISKELKEQAIQATVLVDEPEMSTVAKKKARSTNGYSGLPENEVSGSEQRIGVPIALDVTQSDDPPAVSTAKLDEHINKLLSGQFDEETSKELLAGNDQSISLLVANFPGPLSCDRFQEMGKLPDISNHGPLLRMLALFGKKLVPHVLPLLDSFDSEIRFYATFLFAELGIREVIPQLVKRVFDNDRQIRSVAVDCIHAHTGSEEYSQVIGKIADVLISSETTLEKKRVAAEVLGQLKEPHAIEPLASMLGSVDGILAERCQRALVRITFKDFGFSERRWVTWHAEKKYTHRIEWAIEAIIDKNDDIRRFSIDELRHIVGSRIDWPKPPLDSKQRRKLNERLTAWWDAGGRDLFPITLS